MLLECLCWHQEGIRSGILSKTMFWLQSSAQNIAEMWLDFGQASSNIAVNGSRCAAIITKKCFRTWVCGSAKTCCSNWTFIAADAQFSDFLSFLTGTAGKVFCWAGAKDCEKDFHNVTIVPPEKISAWAFVWGTACCQNLSFGTCQWRFSCRCMSFWWRIRAPEDAKRAETPQSFITVTFC